MTQTRNYADSHRVLKISAKRFAASPFVGRYATEDTVFGVYGGRLYPLSTARTRSRGTGACVVKQRCSTSPSDRCRSKDPMPSVLRPGPHARRHRAASGARRVRHRLRRERRHHHGRRLAARVPRAVLVRARRGDITGWLPARAAGMDVSISDPDSWVLQIQGQGRWPSWPALSWMRSSSPSYSPSPRRGSVTSRSSSPRTGWSGELGFEVYTLPGIDGPALWDDLLGAGQAPVCARRASGGSVSGGSRRGSWTTVPT